MCPSIPVLTGKSAERNTLMLICSMDDLSDGTSMSATVLSLYLKTKKVKVKLALF